MCNIATTLSPHGCQIRLCINSQLENVSLLGTSITALCKDIGMSDMDCYQVQTAATEAINNAIIHAYQEASDQLVNVIWHWHDNKLTIDVIDSGNSMTNLPPDIEPDPMAGNGRGWWIMRRWMDSVDYYADQENNLLRLTKTLSN